MSHTSTKQKGKTRIDYSLLLKRIEQAIVGDADPEKYRRTLSRHDLWSGLQPQQRRQWARLAQMAGLPDEALAVLSDTNRKLPEYVPAWLDRMELLLLLERRGELAQAAAEARGVVSERDLAPFIKSAAASETAAEPEWKTVTAPFDSFQLRRRQVKHYRFLFSGREDCFARQWVNRSEGTKGYVPVRKSMTALDVEEHISGKRTYGFYLVRPDNTVKVGVIDADLCSQFRAPRIKASDRNNIRRETHYMISRIKELARESGLAPLVEFSGGKGFHFWFFFEPPVPAAEARRVLERLSSLVGQDLSTYQLEVFPKQDRLSGKGLGNLVKLPLGIHRETGKQSYFLDCPDRRMEAQLAFLLDVAPVRLPESLLPGPDAPARIVTHPRHRKWTESYPELAEMESLCPPIGQVIASCRQGHAISFREEKTLFQTIGFLPRAKSLMHHLLGSQSEYNAHLVDYKLSRIKGTPLSCRRIHSLLNFAGDFCNFSNLEGYPHPLRHLKDCPDKFSQPAEKVQNLQGAIENLKLAMSQVERFLR